MYSPLPEGVEIQYSYGFGAVGQGIGGYSAAALRRIKGIKTAEVRKVLPRATEEAVHRDYFVLD